jgi:excisionase family DNA binding protein
MPKNRSVAHLSNGNGRPVGRRYAKINDAAAYLDVNPITIRNMLKDGRLRGYRSGTRLLRVDLNEIDALLAGENPGVA